MFSNRLTLRQWRSQATGTDVAAGKLMITICLIAYLTVTCLFIAGVAFAAGRPIPVVPEMQIVQQELAKCSADSDAVAKAA